MDMHVEKLLMQFDDNVETLNKMKSFVDDYLKDLICVKNKIFIAGIESRVKGRASLEGKLLLKGQKYKDIYDITDLLGARVVTFYQDHVDLIATFIEKNFIVDYDNSIDKRKIYEVDRFGYMSLHYICQIPETLYKDEAFPNINKIKFEIQLRSSLQHVWATIFHDTGYKSDVEVPKEYIRRLARLEGLLEIADDEFMTIRNEIDNYRNKIRSLVSEGKFKDISFNIDSYKNYLLLDPFKDLIKKIASINNAEVVPVNYIKFYDTLAYLGIKYLNDLEKIRIENTDDAYKLALIQLGETDLDIISSTIALQNILIVYEVKRSANKADIEKLLKMMNGERNVYPGYVDKIMEQTKGIVKI